MVSTDESLCKFVEIVAYNGGELGKATPNVPALEVQSGPASTSTVGEVASSRQSATTLCYNYTGHEHSPCTEVIKPI